MGVIAADTRECMQVLASIAACILNLWLHGTVHVRKQNRLTKDSSGKPVNAN